MPAEDVAVLHRQAVRQFASGVAVLTIGEGDRVHGTTVSSVTAVSRDPLLVAACLNRHSGFVDLVLAGRTFAVNVLTDRQAGVAAWFADPTRPTGLAQFERVAWEPDPHSGVPLLTGSLSRFGCRLSRCIPAGDHYLLLAEVTSGSTGEGAPLLHFRGRLHTGALGRITGSEPQPVAAAMAMTAPPARP